MPASVDPNCLKLTNPEGTQGVLVGCRCRDCGISVFGPATFCQGCTSSDLEPVELSKRGILYSYTTVRVPPAGWPGPVPYVLGQVELPEGPQVLAELVDCPESDLKIGLEVELTLHSVQPAEGDTKLVVYKWRPAPETQESQREQN